MSAEKVERVAEMNPTAVEEAKVFTGLVYYHIPNRHEHIEIAGKSFVEVGKWATAGNEQTPGDFDCTYYAALLLGYGLEQPGNKTTMSWLCAEEGNPTKDERTGDRKYLIHQGFDKSGRITPFSPEEATIITEQINFVLEQARQVRGSGLQLQEILRTE